MFYDNPEINESLPQLLGHKSVAIRFEVARLFLAAKRYKHYENACKVILDVAEGTSDNTVKAVIGLELKKLVASWEEPVFSSHLSRLTRVILKTVSFDIRSTFLETSSLFLDSDNFLEFIQFATAEVSKNLQNKDAKPYRHQLLIVCKDILIRSSSEQVQTKCVDVFMLAVKNPEDCKMALSMIKEILASLPRIRELLTTKLCEHLNSLSSAAALAIWIIGEYTRTEKGCLLALEKIESFFAHQLENHEPGAQKTASGATKQHIRTKNLLLPALLFSVGKLLAVFYINKSVNYKEFRCKSVSFLLHVLKYCRTEIRLDKECIDRAWTILNAAIFPDRLSSLFAAKRQDEDTIPSRKETFRTHEIDSAIPFSDYSAPKSTGHVTNVKSQLNTLSLTG